MTTVASASSRPPPHTAEAQASASASASRADLKRIRSESSTLCAIPECPSNAGRTAASLAGTSPSIGYCTRHALKYSRKISPKTTEQLIIAEEKECDLDNTIPQQHDITSGSVVIGPYNASLSSISTPISSSLTMGGEHEMSPNSKEMSALLVSMSKGDAETKMIEKTTPVVSSTTSALTSALITRAQSPSPTSTSVSVSASASQSAAANLRSRLQLQTSTSNQSTPSGSPQHSPRKIPNSPKLQSLPQPMRVVAPSPRHAQQMTAPARMIEQASTSSSALPHMSSPSSSSIQRTHSPAAPAKMELSMSKLSLGFQPSLSSSTSTSTTSFNPFPKQGTPVKPIATKIPPPMFTPVPQLVPSVSHYHITSPWSIHDMERLTTAVQTYGTDWNQVARYVERTPVECATRWNTYQSAVEQTDMTPVTRSRNHAHVEMPPSSVTTRHAHIEMPPSSITTRRNDSDSTDNTSIHPQTSPRMMSTEDDVIKRRRNKRGPLELPQGWKMVERISSKCRYKTYVSPQGKPFRSLASVHRYLEKQQQEQSAAKSEQLAQQRLAAEVAQRQLTELRDTLMKSSSNIASPHPTEPIRRNAITATPIKKESLEEEDHAIQTLLITHIACLQLHEISGHFESAKRLHTILSHIASTSTLSELDWISASAPASIEDLTAVHSSEYIDAIISMCKMVEKGTFPYLTLDPPYHDTVITPATRESILHAAGSVITAVDAVMDGDTRNVFVAVRPPGHHAQVAKPGGFCLINNIAIGVSHARRTHSVSRIAIIDFDPHHANGTQSIFMNDMDVLLISIHRPDIFPFTATQDTDASNIINLPVTSRNEYLATTTTIYNTLDHFSPELIFISAGFDGHKLELQTCDFDEMTHTIMLVAEKHCEGRIVSVLEGGYDLDTIGTCVVSHLKCLMTRVV